MAADGRPASRATDLLAIGLVIVIAAAVLPLGGNRPFAWGIAGLGLGLVAALYAGFGWRSVPMPAWRWESWCFAGFVAFALVQLAPLPASLDRDGFSLDFSSISLAPTDSVLSLLTWLQFGLLFAFIAVVGNRRHRALRVVEALFWVACAEAAIGLVSLYALGDTLLGAAKTQYQGFATGTFVNRNAFASYVAAAIPVGMAILATPGDGGDPIRRRWMAGAHAAGLALLVAALLASGSRMGLLAGAVGAGLALAVMMTTGALRNRPLLAGAAAICAVLAVAGFGVPLLQRFIAPGDDLATRLTLYGQVWEAILARPWTGYGGGSFASVFPVFQHAPLPGELVWQRAHSTYLALWFEYGLVAGSIPMAIVAALWLACLDRLVRNGIDRVVLAAMASTAVFAVHAAVDFSLEMHGAALTMTALIGLGTGAVRGGPLIRASRK